MSNDEFEKKIIFNKQQKKPNLNRVQVMRWGLPKTIIIN